jgi:hypothetical protein
LSNTPSSSERLTPFNLVQQAYRGSFMAQGIPNYRTLSAACQSGRINGLRGRQAPVKPENKRIWSLDPPKKIVSLLTMRWIGVGRGDEGVPGVW